MSRASVRLMRDLTGTANFASMARFEMLVGRYPSFCTVIDKLTTFPFSTEVTFDSLMITRGLTSASHNIQGRYNSISPLMNGGGGFWLMKREFKPPISTDPSCG